MRTLADGVAADCAHAIDAALCLTVTGTVSLVVAAQASSRPVDPMPYVWALGLGALMMLPAKRTTLVLAMTAVGFFVLRSGLPGDRGSRADRRRPVLRRRSAARGTVS